MNFLPTITTTEGSDWLTKVKEADDLGIEKVAVFPTCLDSDQRREMYLQLEKSSIKKIPFVHIRGDMELWEIEYFIKKFNTVIFNVHSSRQYDMNPELIKYKEIICVENHDGYIEKDLKNFGGACLDFAHMENEIMLSRVEEKVYFDILKRYPIKCNHISAIKDKIKVDNREISYDSHHLDELSELDYLKRYPLEFFSNHCAIELENSLKRQLEAIDYIKELLSFRDELIKKIF
ncbi:MAG: hypothetical protein PHW52_04315 [Candidatus Pacebacteria bacterium]|nr:hypothetical protein [Candidatus Paceibacterota bacterium]